ncbi:UTP--glucose-1-phosphate uridylyltransferase [Paenibacillus beijingensis]|uniref:UTP--glucose-1-phosphate uridylyltransferase n=1 Tax=Paenibacillus beijingensis TaxID=1126833 RepID=A0A0D5NNM6_9BACL|nr:UTP--glucose-1-phosphate uridylyltransferase [Paenibacillus beijingensis]AJY76750.1 hypothetical protein VN24_22000 [Paenibacillus beijingensis]
MITKAIIPAAGYGTRNLPVTKAVPKEMFPISGRPVIDYVVQEAIGAGIKEILIILSRSKTSIMDYFDRSMELESFLTKHNKTYWLPKIAPPPVQIHYVRQSEALGLGSAVHLASTFAAGDAFAVLLPDQVSLEQPSPLLPLISLYEKCRTSVVGLQVVPEERLSHYGVADIGGYSSSRTVQINRIVEKPKTNPPSNLVVMGRYIFTPAIFDYLNEINPGEGQEIQLTDAMNALCENEPIGGYLYHEKWYDTSIENDYLSIQRRAYRLKNKQK